MYEFWYDYVKPKYGEKVKLYVIWITVYIKTDTIYKDIAENAETRFDTSNYELLRLFPNTAQKMNFSIKDFFRKCDQIRSSLLGYIY